MKAFLLNLATLAVPASAHAQTVTIDNGNTVQLCGACASRQARLAVTTEKLELTEADTIRVSEVSSGNVREEEWKRWITPLWEPAIGSPVALILDINDSLNRTGTYDVLLQVRPSLPKLKLQLVQPAGQLEVPDKLLIERHQFFPGSKPRGSLVPLTVREATGLTRVSSIAFANKQAMHGTEGVSGRLLPLQSQTAGSLPVAAGVVVPAGGPAEIPYRLEGDFPRGLVTGVVRLVAPQLSQPVLLNYEVRTRLVRGWILLAILLGLLLGYVVRNKLQERIALAQARQQALATLELLDDRLPQYDASVRDAIAPERQELETAANGSVPETIIAKLTALEGNLKSALQEYERRHTDAKIRLVETQQLLSLPWRVPRRVAQALEQQRTAVAEVATHLAERKADLARDGLTSLSQTLARELRSNGLEWQTAAKALIEDLKGARLGIPEAVRVQFQAQQMPELGRIKEQEIEPKPSALIVALGDLEAELRGYTELMTSLQRRAEREWLDYRATWNTIPLPKPETLTDLEQKYTEFFTAVSAAPDEPSRLRADLSKTLASLQDAWSSGILSQVDANAALRPRIEKAVKDREFVLAGNLMAAAVQKLEIALGGPGRAPPVPAAWAPIRLDGARSSSLVLTASPGDRPQPVPGLLRGGVERELKAARLLQTVIIGVLMALWAFSVYAKDYDGTFAGLLTPFFATFLLDISVEGLKGQMKVKSPSGS